MNFLRKTFPAVSVLLVLLMSTVLVLPSGLDLALCFGSDGHVDLSLSRCPDGATSGMPAGGRQPDIAHHDDCLHVAVACGTAQELIRTEGQSDSSTSQPKKAPCRTSLLFWELPANSADAHLNPKCYPVLFEDCSSAHVVSLGTIILLI